MLLKVIDYHDIYRNTHLFSNRSAERLNTDSSQHHFGGNFIIIILAGNKSFYIEACFLTCHAFAVNKSSLDHEQQQRTITVNKQ